MDCSPFRARWFAAIALACSLLPAHAQTVPEFNGTIGRTRAESTPDFPPPLRARAGSPNIVYIVLDDTGFADLGAYGSEIHTPHLDALADNGLRYNNFHTDAVCSSTRAALLTGRNSHSVGMGNLTHVVTGFPGKRGEISHAAATVAEILRGGGYATYAVGKWHLIPPQQLSVASALNQWPLQRGFDRFYGFLGGMTDQFHPTLVQDNTPIDPPATADYHFSTDITDHAIGYLKEQAAADPDKPFFLYYALGATHAPHQVPAAFVDKYEPVYAQGWDRLREARFAQQKQLGIIPGDTRLTPRNDGVPAWSALNADEQRVAVRLQAAFAGFLEHTDREIGRLVALLDQLGQLDNTLIVVVSDNGTSAEGGRNGSYNETYAIAAGKHEPIAEQLQRLNEVGTARTFTNYPQGWAMVGNTPFRDYKHSVDLGGVRDPLIVSWPRGIKQKGGIRNQFVDVIDITPTVLAAAGLKAPAAFAGVPQKPLEGVSIAATFDDAAAPHPRRVQYFELWGRRAIWRDGWMAVSNHRPGENFDDDSWRLYDLNQDFSGSIDHAAEQPALLASLKTLWWNEAAKYNVLPLDESQLNDAAFQSGGGRNRQREVFTYFPAAGNRPYHTLPYGVAPETTNRSFDIEATLDGRKAGDGGVILAMGDRFGGYVLYVDGDRLHFDYNDFGKHTRLVSRIAVPAGAITVGYRYHKTGDFTGRATLLIDGREVATATLTTTPTQVTSWAGMDVGRDVGSPVSDVYADRGGFPFAAGRLQRVVLQLQEQPPR